MGKKEIFIALVIYSLHISFFFIYLLNLFLYFTCIFGQLSQTSKTDSDTVSLSSSLGRQSGRAEEVVELTVHGIVDVGKKQS